MEKAVPEILAAPRVERPVGRLRVQEDDARSAEKRGERDGGKGRYIALEHIQSVSLQEQAEDLLTLSLTLTPGGRQVDSIFAASQKPEIAQLQEKLKKLIG